MSCLTQGYDLALLKYKSVRSAEDLLKSNSSVSGNSTTTDKNTFVKMLSEKTTGNISYTDGNQISYNADIPALRNSKVQQRIKDNNIDQIVSMASQKYNVPEKLIYKVIEAESYFNPNDKSSAGAMGLMQLMPETCKSNGVTNPYDPYQNIMAGTSELGRYIKKYDGDLKLSLAAYNAGPGNVAKYGGVPPFKETQNYIKKILGVSA